MLSSRKNKSLEDLLVKALQSQTRMNDALVSDLESLQSRLEKVEQYLEIVEARRDAELNQKGKLNG